MLFQMLVGLARAQFVQRAFGLGSAESRPVGIGLLGRLKGKLAMVLVEQALLQLPMHLRAAATLRFIEGRSHPEIAEILNQPIGTVKSHVHRAVRVLRKILGPQLGRFTPEGAPAHALS